MTKREPEARLVNQPNTNYYSSLISLYIVNLHPRPRPLYQDIVQNAMDYPKFLHGTIVMH